MSIKTNGAYPTLNSTGLATKSLPESVSNSQAWVRNPSWLTLTPPLSTDQKFVGLCAVYPGDGVGSGGNFIAFTVAGNYTVDWGDGSAPQNFTSGAVAEYEFNYNDTDLNGTNAPVTFTASTSTVNRTAHGYSNGMTVQFYNIVTTTGLSENTQYYVINATANTFQVSSTLNGSAVSLTNNGSATLLPYKQVIVTITPQAGQSLTSINLQQRHSQTGLQFYDSNFLDIAVSGSQLSILGIGVSTPGSSTSVIRFSSLQRVNIVNSNIKAADELFYFCTALQSINFVTAATASNLNVTFTAATSTVNCTAHGLSNGDPVCVKSLVTTTGISVGARYFVISATANTFQLSDSYNGSAVTLTNDGSGVLTAGTSFYSTFQNCASLANISLFDTSSAITMQSMFNACVSLVAIPLFNTQSVLNISSMFAGCYALNSVPLINTSSCILFSSIFQDCISLETVPLFNTSLATTMSSMFTGCYGLKSVPLFNTGSVTNMSSMFNNCYSLESVPLFSMGAVTNMSNMFFNCYSLESVPLFNTVSVTNMTNTFSGCIALKSLPLFNTASVTNMTSTFALCRSLKTVPLFNTASVTTMNGTFAQCSALESVPAFNTPALTNTASMFQLCISLKNVPLFNTASVTNMSSMFSNCSLLKTIPLFNAAAVTNFVSMFASCSALESIPALTTTAGTTFGSMFATCSSLARIQAKNFRFSFSVANAKLSSTALNEIYTNLPTVTSQTITVTNNYGTAGDNPSIATAKGWTVTG